MSIDQDDTKLILELATFAAKAITKDASAEIFDRVNHLHEKQADRIDEAVALMSETGRTMAATTEQIRALGDRIEHMATEDYAARIAREMVDKCAETHKDADDTAKGFRYDRVSIMIALVALGTSTVPTVSKWVEKLFP